MFRTSLLTASLLMATASCAAELDELDQLDQTEQGLTAHLGTGLSTGTRTSLVSVVGAENVLLTSTGKLLVTGDRGIYEVEKSGTSFRAVVRQPQPAQTCQFGGITETRGTVYANCYAGFESYLYAAPVSSLVFQKISTLAGRGLANGLSSDPAGNLYVATTAQDQIVRLAATANPLVMAPFSLFLDRSGALTNGLKYHAGKVYWTDVGAVNAVPVRADGSGDKAAQVQVAKYYNRNNPWDTTVFDDLAVDDDGLLVCDFTRNAIRAFAFDGSQLGLTPGVFRGPSAVVRARGWGGFSPRALIVTERSANRVSVFEPAS